jgi:hypothetical protein
MKRNKLKICQNKQNINQNKSNNAPCNLYIEYKKYIDDFDNRINITKIKKETPNINNKEIEEYDEQIKKIKQEEYDFYIKTNQLLNDYTYRKTASNPYQCIKKKDTLSYKNTFKELRRRNRSRTLNISTIKTTETKQNIYDEIIAIANNDIYINDLYNDEYYCNKCSEYMQIMNCYSRMICPTCKTEKDIMIDYETPSYREPQTNENNTTQLRMKHFVNILMHKQAKESVIIPDIIKHLMIVEAYENKLNIVDEEFAKNVLQKYSYERYYINIPKILHVYFNMPPLKLPTNLEKTLIQMFQIFSKYFESNKCNRINMLTYNLLIHTFLILLGEHDKARYFKVLKEKEKRETQENIIRSTCRSLGWIK